MISLINFINVVFRVESDIKDMNLSSSSQELFFTWMKDGMQKLQPLVNWSNFLSRSILGIEWQPFLAWQTENSAEYRKNLLDHIKHLKTDAYSFIQMIEKAQLKNHGSNLDADDTLKVSKGKVNAIIGSTFLVEGDATPGSSGSLIIDSSGNSVGIVFQIRRVGKNENDLCLLDAMMTDFESIRFSYCPSLGPTAVSSKVIFETLQHWGIRF